MRIRQIGNGSAFNHKMTNSSFLIENEDKYILFDCGSSVFQKIREMEEDETTDFDIKKLNAIYITHLDYDHFGSLGTLIYYMYFTHGITLDLLISDAHVGDNIPLPSCEKFDLYNFIPIGVGCSEDFAGITIEPTSCEQHIECCGAIFTNNEEDQCIFISGDTKATTEIRNHINTISMLYKDFMIFHDFSNWNNPEENVHACKSDTEEIYGNLCNIINWYHNDESFQSGWRVLNE